MIDAKALPDHQPHICFLQHLAEERDCLFASRGAKAERADPYRLFRCALVLGFDAAARLEVLELLVAMLNVVLLELLEIFFVVITFTAGLGGTKRRGDVFVFVVSNR